MRVFTEEHRMVSEGLLRFAEYAAGFAGWRCWIANHPKGLVNNNRTP
jgi:hypothetical protein